MTASSHVSQAEDRPVPTPLMRKISAIKALHPDKLVLSQLGDYYALFASDARRAAKLLGIRLQRRAVESTSPIAMAFIHRNDLNDSITRLCHSGHTIAVCTFAGAQRVGHATRSAP